MNIRADINRIVTRLYMLFIAKQNLKSDSHHILVACQPKTGSTYLARIFSELPDFRVACLVPGYGRREQELDSNLLLSFHYYQYVAHHHTRYSESTAALLKRFNIKSLVLVRNVFDVVISLRDHFRNERIVVPMGYVCPYMKKWDDSDLEHFIVHMIIPWYFNFYLSWMECENKYLVRYEDLNRDALSVVSSINDRFSLGFEVQQLRQAIGSANSKFTRKNKAILGRGTDLEDSTKKKINLMASFYKGIDFSPMGIS